MTSSITYGIVTLRIDNVTSFLQLSGVQNVRKSEQELREIMTVCSDGGIVINSEGFVHIFNLFVC